MASIVVNGDTSGAVTLSAPAVAGTVTVTLPAASGTMLTTASTGVVTQAMLSTNVAGNGPAFSAYQSAATTLSNTNFTKILLATEEFDTNNNFASSTFTPTVAGYYQLSGVINMNGTGTAGSIILSTIYKNGARFKDGSMTPINNSQGGWSGVSCVIYFNGSTDYAELYGYMSGPATLTTQTPSHGTYFTGAMVRSA